jgi:hypothetical protein
MRVFLAVSFLVCSGHAFAQGYQCRTSPVGASTAYCASEAFVTQSGANDVQGPVSAVSGDIAVFDGTTGKLIKDGGAIPTTGPGIDQNTLNAQSSNYPIVAGDAGKVIYETGGPFTVTLPAVSGFASNAVVGVCNGNANSISSHAVLMSGFPDPVLARLYPKQCVTVAIENGTWVAKSVPGRFRAAFIPVIYVDTGGSDSNDGLISNAAGNPLRHVQTCLNIFQTEYDLFANQAACSPTGGQTFVESGGVLYQPQNARVFFITGNGGVATIQTGTNVVLELSDFAGYVILQNITLDCTGATHPCFDFFVHQQNGFDIFPTVTFIGANAGDVGIWCDSMCKANVSSVPTFSGTFLNLVQLNLGSMFVVSNGLTLSASISVAKDIILADQGSQVQWSGPLTLGASNSVNQVFGATNGANIVVATFSLPGSAISGGARQWAILNNALFCNASATAIPGTAGLSTAGGGWSAGIIAAPFSGACIP